MEQYLRDYRDAILKRETNSLANAEEAPLQPTIPLWKMQWPAPKLIGLAGPARSGKDTVASLLKSAFPVKSVAFADPIRAMLAAGFGFDQRHFHGELKETVVDWIGKSYRQMAQTLGTEWGRELVNDKLWVLCTYEQVKKIHAAGFHAVVTDVRFDNEADFIREKNGTIWHLHRPDVVKVNAHASEAGVAFKQGDLLIVNDSSIENLLNEVMDAFEMSKD
jgi:hypothetical protein